jgi:hypothetical protein
MRFFKRWRARNERAPATPAEVGTDEPGNPWPEVTADALDRIHEAGIQHAIQTHEARFGRRIVRDR